MKVVEQTRTHFRFNKFFSRIMLFMR